MNNKISKEKLEKYFQITETALDKVKNKIFKEKESEAREIIQMVENYISDAHYFESKGDFVNAFAAINYSHGWIDLGVRLKIFDVNDDKLFTIR
jgi:hypothetical protein